MGRDKDSSARKAGGRTAASSSGAAAMVAAMGAGGGLTFAAFDPSAAHTDAELDPDIALALKKLNKKDSTTKIKALGELLGFFSADGGRTDDELALVLPLWQLTFDNVAMDADRRVREALFVALRALVVRVKKHMTKHIRGLMLPWLCARFDTEASVRAAANAAFSALFPPAKIGDAFLYCKSEILHGLDANLAHTVQTLCDPKIFSKEEADDTIARVHASSLLALAHVLEALSKEQALEFAEGFETLHKAAFWKLSTNTSVHVRAAFYTAMRAITVQAPSLLHDNAADADANSKMKVAGAAIMQGLSEKDPAAHSQMWECLLIFCRTFPSALAAMDLSKAVLPRLFALVKGGAYGSAVESFPCLVPFATLCQEASPQLTDKIHTGLLLSLWESLASIRVGRGGDDGACAATVRAYFECLLHGWQTTVESGADQEKILALTSVGLLPCLDALLTPDGRGTDGVPGGRAGLLAATVKCTELLCSRCELAAARSPALQVVETRLLSCRIVGGAEDMDDGVPAEEAREISALVCAFKLNSAGCEELLPIMGSLCKKLQARCWEIECEDVIRLPQLRLLCDITSHWGVNVLSEGTGEQPCEAAGTLMSESIIPLVSSTLEKRTGGEGMNGSLPDDAKKLLDLVFRLVGLLVIEQPSSEEGENALWIALLKSVAGGSELPGDSARVEAVAMLVRCAGTFKGPQALSKQLICVMLDRMVHDASVRLLLRQGHSDEPGMLLSARLHELILAVLPQTSKGGRTDFLISEKALANLIQRLTRVMCFWTDDSARSRGKTMEDECLVEGSSVTAAMSSAAMAGLDTVECVLLASQTGRLPSSCSNFVSPILSALFRLRVHSEDMIGGAADTDRAHPAREHNSDRPSYDYDANSASRLRSRTGLRACTVWDKCARVVLINALREQGSGGVSWLLDRARETRESISASLLVTEALVLGDQASEIVSVAKACEYHVSSILALLFEDCLALPQGSSTTQHAASMWLAFGLRFLHSVGQETMITQLELEISSKRETSPILWLLEELVLAYGGNNAFKPVQGVLSRPSCAADQTPCVWSHAAVSGGDDENVDASSCPQQPAQARGAAEGKIANILPDIQLAWNKLVTPIVIGRAGNAAGAACVSNIAHHLVFKCLSKTVEGYSQWPQALGHLLSLLAQSGDTKYLRLCEEMMTMSGAGKADAMLQGSGILLVGKARLIVVLVKMVADLLCRSESEVHKSEASDVLLYCNSPGQVEEVTLLAVHCEEFPPFFSIRMSDGREKQTEAHRLSSIPWLASISPECGAVVSTTAELLNSLRDLLKALAIVCAKYILQNSAPIGAALDCDEGEEAGTRAVASLVLVALRELCRCRQHHLMGSDLWLQVLESSCQWFDPGRQSALPSPESAYMLAATAGLVTGGHDVGLDSELTGYRIADSLGCDPGGQIDAHVLSYWLAQLAAEPRGGCVRALCSRPAAWAQLAARVHLVIVSKAFWGSAAQGMAMQVLQIAEAYALVPLAGGSDPSAGAPVADGADSEDEVIEVMEDEDGDEDEVIEILEDEDEEDDKVQQGGKQADAARTKGASVHAHVAWERSRFCGFAHVLGELISVRDTPVAGLAPQHVSRVRLLATVAAAAPKEVLQLTLVHLDRKRRQALCDALHLLLPATDVVVQTSAYMLLSRFYTLPALLMHLDALEWEGLEPEREDEEAASPSTPAGTCSKQTTDLLRAVPAPLARALRTSADAAGQSGGASPAAAEDALMSTECLGVLLAWLLVLEFRPRCSARLQGNLSAYLRNQPLLQPLLSIAFAHVVSSDALASPGGSQQLPSVASLEKAPQLAKLGTEEADDAMTDLAGHILFRSVAAFPSLVRLWYNDLDRGTASRVDKFVASCISPLILAKEVSVISGAAASMDDAGELSIRASSKTREITAAYTKDEAVLEVVLRVPPSYPLRPIQVDGTRRVGVSEGKWKKWALAMRTLLDNKDGSLLDAVLLWKKNVDQVFEGVEECPICYTVIHMVNNTLPKLTCHTCRNKFHSACLYKWFNTSNKSACPLCQSPWYS